MQINAYTGAVSGAPSAVGASHRSGRATPLRRQAAGSYGSSLHRRVAQYVRLVADSEVNGNPWTSMAEFNLLDASDGVMLRIG